MKFVAGRMRIGLLIIILLLWLVEADVFQLPQLHKHFNVTSKASREIPKMTYDFFADETDKIQILEFIFGETDLQVFDYASSPGQEICKYKNVDQISSKFDLVNGEKFAATFNLWTPRHKGDILFRRVVLDPKRCNGQTFRYSTDGWGLIQLYFGGFKNNELNQSHLGHFNEKGAMKHEGSNSFNGKVSNWDWKEIQLTSRKLKHYIHTRLAARKVGSFGVLVGAERLTKQGDALR
jgi:hypothetical protein